MALRKNDGERDESRVGGGTKVYVTALESTRESNRLLKSQAMTSRQRRGVPVNHYNEMSHLPKGQCSAKGRLLKSSILDRPYPSALPLLAISPGAGLPSLSPSL